MKRIKLYQNNLITCRDKVVVPFQGGITALLKFNNNSYLGKLCKDTTPMEMFQNFVEFEFNKKKAHEHFALSFENSQFVLITRFNDEPFVFKPCGDNHYCAMEQYGSYTDCGNCPENIGCDGWDGNHSCGNQICEYSCTYCQYNNYCYQRSLEDKEE
jgi:hypothetical protein